MTTDRGVAPHKDILMKQCRLIGLCALVFLFAGPSAYADAPVWKV